MNKFRIKKDIAVSMMIMTNGEARELEGRDLRVEVNYNGPSKVQPVVINDYETEGNKLMFVFHGIHHRFLGKYTISVWENYGTTGQTVVDKRHAFELVSTTEEECRGDDTNLEMSSADIGVLDLTLGIGGKDGKDGVGVANVETITESEDDGGVNTYRITLTNGATTDIKIKNGRKGNAFTYDDFTEEQIADLQKPATDAAIEAQKQIDEKLKQVDADMVLYEAEVKVLVEEMEASIDKAHSISDQSAFVNEALEAVYGDAGIAISDRTANVSGNRYYYDSLHPILLHPGDLIKVTCTRNNGTALLTPSQLLITFAGAGKVLEYTSKTEQTVHIATYGTEDAQGCAYVVKRADNLIDVCKKAVNTISALTKRVEELERRRA